jgi:glycine/D-amino acid oxidase-like deaminating enzyme
MDRTVEYANRATRRPARTEGEMATSADVVVIGGGVNGASTAFHLASMGAGKVSLLERSALGAGATGKSGALVRMHYTNPHDAALAQASLPYFEQWSDRVGAGDPGFHPYGVVRLAPPRFDDRLRANVDMLRGLGVETSVISTDDLKAIDPGVYVGDVDCAAWEPRSGYADPSATAFGFAEGARQRGAEIHVGVEAIAIETDGERVTGVATNVGRVATDTVVLVAGAWSNRLLEPLGFDFGLQPNRVQIVILRRPAGAEAAHPVYIDGINNTWLRPEGDYGVLAGIGRDQLGIDPDLFDEGVDFDYIVDCRKRLAARRPALANAYMRGGWAGVIMMSPDGHAIIDELRGRMGDERQVANGRFARIPRLALRRRGSHRRRARIWRSAIGRLPVARRGGRRPSRPTADGRVASTQEERDDPAPRRRRPPGQ